MWIVNLLLVLLNLLFIGIWVSLLKVPYLFLFPAIMAFSVVGIYSTNDRPFDLFLLVIFGVLGVIWRILECRPVPLMLGLVLGLMMESSEARVVGIKGVS